jgi:hypothetical protein
MGHPYSRYEEIRKAYIILVGKRQGKRPLGITGVEMRKIMDLK